MKTLLSKLNIKVASSIGVSLFLVFAFSLALAPRTISTALADQTNCPPPPGFSSLPTSPLFNPYPVTVNGEAGINCEDSPTLSAGIHNSGTWSDSSVQANVGDTVSLRVYIHNGAASNSGAVMHNVAYNVNLDTSVGTSHAVTVQLTASNAAEKDGSVTINIPDGAHLEYSGGDPLHQNLGDQQPCFQYVQQFKITLIVVGGTVTPPNPPANSTASLSLNSTTFCVYSKNDGTNQIPTYTVTGSSNLGGQEVIWASTKNGVPTGESNDYYGQNLNSSGYWTGTGGAWTVNDIGSWTKTASIFANGKVSASSQPFAFTVKDCSGTTTTPPPTSSVTLSINLGTFCIYSKNDGVNQTPVYSVNGSSNLAGEDILWSSTKNGVSTGESNDYYNQKLDASGHYVSTNDSQPTRPWNNSDIGNWTKTASIFNSSVITATSQPVSFVVKDCSGATTNPTSLSCSASVASANIGDNVQFTAVGGNNTYTWATSNNTNAGSGSLFNVNFASGGNKLVSVTSNGQTANCGVFINTPGSTSSGNTTNTNTNISNNCVNYSCNNTSTNNYTNTTTTYAPPAYPVYNYSQPPVYYPPQPVYAAVNTYSPSVLGGSVNLTYSKTAFNNTKNVNAVSVPASKEDRITYTLTVTNSGNTPDNNFVVTDDLSQVLPYADVVDNGGGYLSGNTISYPSITVPANGSVSESFQVVVKFSLSDTLSYTMVNTYGNTVTININRPQVLGAFTAPKTGADTNAFVFATLLTSGAALVTKRKVISKLLFS